MKTIQIYLLAFAAVMLTACAKTKTKTAEEKVTEAFKEYVKTDFDDPDDFIEITRHAEKDTISTWKLKKQIHNLDLYTLRTMLPNDTWGEFMKIDDALDDSISIVQHKIKVRVKSGDGSTKVMDYYVIEQNGEYNVQDHAMTQDEMPEAIDEALEWLKKAMRDLNSLSNRLFNKDLY